MPERIPDDRRAQIADAIREGHGTRSAGDIAREFGIATSTIIRIARETGQRDAFERAQTKNATEARTADMRDQRTMTATRFLAKANELLEQLDGPFLAYSFGGKDNTYNEMLLDGPPTTDIRNLMTSAAVAIDKHLVLERHDQDDGLSELGSMLEGLVDRFGLQRKDTGDA